MKIKYDHLETLKKYVWNDGVNNAMEVFQVKTGACLLGKYSRLEIPRAENVKDIDKRFCFDMFYYARIPSEFVSELYAYLNDDQIYTALKHILPRVND